MADDGDLFDTVKQEQPGSVWSGCIHELLIPDQHGASCLNFMVMNIWIVRLCGCLAQHRRGPGDEGILFLCELLKYILKLVFDFGALTNITYKLIRRGIVNCNNSTESVGYKNRKERLVDDLVLDEVDMKFLKMIDNTSHHIAHYQTTFYNQWTSKVMGKLSPNTSTILLSEFSLIIGSTQCFTIDILITLDISTFILFVLFHCFIEVCMKGRNFNWVLTKILIISHYIIRTLGPGSVDSGEGSGNGWGHAPLGGPVTGDSQSVELQHAGSSQGPGHGGAGQLLPLHRAHQHQPGHLQILGIRVSGWVSN